MQYGWFQSSRVVEIHGSWGFDLGNQDAVFGYAPFVVVGQVEERLGQEDELTYFTVRSIETLKGSLPERLTVAQTGFEAEGVRYESEDQPLLEVGGIYVLALTAPADPASVILTVLAGTVSGQQVDPNDDTRMADLRASAALDVWPEELIDTTEQGYEEEDAYWASEHADEGFAVDPVEDR